MTDPTEISIIKCGTTTGDIVMELHREWSPNGYDRVVELFERRFYDGTHFFRVVPNFLVQFGITYSSDEELKRFARTPIPDDPQLTPKIPFQKGTISFAGSGDNSRTSQIFISYADSNSLGQTKWETPFGKVIEGMENVDKFYSYGDMPPWGKGPVQGKIHSGRGYIEDNFPLTDKFHTCKVHRGGLTKGDQELEEASDAKEWTPDHVARAAPRDPNSNLRKLPLPPKGLGGRLENLPKFSRLGDQLDPFLALEGLVVGVLVTLAVCVCVCGRGKKKRGKDS